MKRQEIKKLVLLTVLSLSIAGSGGCKSKKSETELKAPDTSKSTSSAGIENEVPAENPQVTKQEEKLPKSKTHQGGSKARKILMIIACKNFRDEELTTPKKMLEANGYDVTVASREKSGCTGMLGATATVDTLLSEVNVDEYDGIIFVGGVGAKIYINDPLAHKIARQAVKNGKILGAICIAPSILAKAGVLKGKKATVWQGKEFISILKKGGANYTAEKVTVDGKIITAHGPDAASQFGEKIIEMLKK